MKTDTILLDHGGGGKMAHNLIAEMMIPKFDNPILSFHFGQIYIEHPKEFASICKMQKERDHLFGRIVLVQAGHHLRGKRPGHCKGADRIHI